MQYYSREDIDQLEQRFRAQLINSLSGFKSLNLIGTQSKSGVHNLAVISSVVHLGANPPLMGYISRPIAAPRHTLQNILETGFFTLNHIQASFYEQAHQASARYDEAVSEFEAVGLTPEFSKNFHAPYVKESTIKIGLTYREHMEVSLNETLFVIGEIKEIWLPDDVTAKDGYVDIEKAGTVTCSGLDAYHTTQRLQRLTYAKPDQPVRKLEE